MEAVCLELSQNKLCPEGVLLGIAGCRAAQQPACQVSFMGSSLSLTVFFCLCGRWGRRAVLALSSSLVLRDAVLVKTVGTWAGFQT